jgi:hypothetical protein
MKAAPGGKGGAALFQRRRGLAGTGLLPVPEGVDQVLHCLARHVGISFGMGCPLIRRGWRFGGRASWTCLAENKSAGGRVASASVPGYRREVSSVTMSAADCGSLTSATPCPAHIESASISPVVPAIGGAGS